MSDLQKIGPSLMEMDDVAQYLNVRGTVDYDARGNETDFHPFITTKDKATDVKKVAGVDAGNIAVCVTDQSGNVQRNSVKNALNLEGHPASYFLTADEGGTIGEDIANIKKAYSQELKFLRDELYQLRAELAKSGAVEKYQVNNGFYDTFREKHPAHEAGIVATAIADSDNQYNIMVQDNKYSKFAVGDYILIQELETKEDAIVQITEMQPDMRTITFSPGTGFDIRKDRTVIYKSKGSNINGAFVFGEVSPVMPGKKEYFTGLDDDTYSMRRPITRSHTGFAYSFRIPASMQKSYLTSLGIRVKKYGTPADLMCYIINEKNVQFWRNPEKAAEDGILIAKSQPLNVDATKGEYIAQFDFFDGANYPRLKESDDSENKVRYCAIIEALEADNDNHYEVVFLQNKQNGVFGDLQLNNTTYNYSQKESRSVESALATDSVINACDMYIETRLREAVESSFMPFHDGIYTAKFTTHEPISVNHARLTMRIAREGMFTVSSQGTGFNGGDANAIDDGSTIVVEGETNDDVRGFERCIDKNIIVGTQIRKVTKVNNDRLTLAKGLHVEAGDPVYPMGYTIRIKAQNTEWKADVDDTFIYEHKSEPKIFEMPLVAVMPDGVHRDAEDSDRLIFEVALTDEDDEIKRLYNDFEIQIYWEQSAQAVSDRIIGKIKSLNVSLDYFG